ncbi:MAG: hypothetical protein DI539_05290 [Flavobacterium psychrophilum]|nr:MAG: hypothetical protein DI539_05290 [Flavobacterium psychrophilum]
MDNSYYISLNIKTLPGFDSYATYTVEQDKEKAIAIFGQLKGSPNLSDSTVLTMDLTEINDGILFPLEMLECTFQDVIHNTKIITREIFKDLNFETD